MNFEQNDSCDQIVVFQILQRLYYLISTLAVLALVFWIPALYLFVQKAKDTSLTPAQSRAKNEECLISMFDKHDIWHFLSGAGLLTVFLILLVIDDGIAEVPYDKIPTF